MLAHLRQYVGQAEVQVVDANRVLDGEHLIVAADHASEATEGGFNIAKSLAMECLLYTAAERQIEAAIRKVGVGPMTSNIGLIIFADSEQALMKVENVLSTSDIGVVGDSPVDTWTRARKATIVSTYDLTPKQIRATRRAHESELEAIKKLVFEKMALLSLEAQKS